MSIKAPKVFRAGRKVGHFLLLRRVRPSKKLSANLKVRWKVRCEAPDFETGKTCGKELIVPQHYMKRDGNPKTHCGCQSTTLKSRYREEYGIWGMMHTRTEDPKHVAYHHYGGRGIRVCDRWNKSVAGSEEGFANFLADVGPRPGKDREYSIDRIDVDGMYEPGNVRWATAKEQAANKRPKT